MVVHTASNVYRDSIAVISIIGGEIRMNYLLYSSQEYALDERPHYAGDPNFYKNGMGKLMGVPVANNTNKISEAMSFHYKSQARTVIRNKGFKGYKIIPLDKATQLVMEYYKAKEKRTDVYRITQGELDVLRKFEEFKR